MQILPIVISLITVLFLIASILFFPKIKLGTIQIDTFWIVTMIGAIVLIVCRCVSVQDLKESFFSRTSVNPIKILVLFLSLSSLSIYLDELGMFSHLATFFANRFSKNQYVLFFGFYAMISLLTIFTSNDIIILTFTPFLCVFCKENRINPLPYLMMEFVAANTWSSILIIGNPTNIYLSSFYNLDFMTYFMSMTVPTISASITGLLILFLIFHKSLKEPLQHKYEKENKIKKIPLVFGLLHLVGCTVLLSISSYLNLPMWLIAMAFSLSLMLFVILYSAAEKENQIVPLLKRLPWNLIPFVLSMFVLVLALKNSGLTQILSQTFESWDQVITFGYSGLLCANLINNIPMAVLYSSLLEHASIKAVYASILSSNVAAYITPIGALAGIMFMNLTEKHDVKISFVTFVKYGLLIGLPSATAGFLALRFLP